MEQTVLNIATIEATPFQGNKLFELTTLTQNIIDINKEAYELKILANQIYKEKHNLKS